MSSVFPTELVAKLVFKEKSAVGRYSATSQRPGPGMPAMGVGRTKASSRSACAPSLGAPLFGILSFRIGLRSGNLKISGDIRENLHAIGQRIEAPDGYAARPDAIEHLSRMSDLIPIVPVKRAYRWSRQ